MKQTSTPIRGRRAAQWLLTALLSSPVMLAWGAPELTVSDVQRGVERELERLRQPALALPAPTPKPFQAPAAEADISKLVGVQVEVPTSLEGVSSQIELYWMQYLRKAVSSEQITAFKAWLWEDLQKKGYLGYVNLTYNTQADGTMLYLKVLAPRIGRTTVLALDAQEQEKFAHIVAQRFAKAYPDGAFVDIQGIEAQLKAIAYDLPVDLEASLRQTDSEVIDVAINMKRVDAKPGEISSALLQLNNHGTEPYGREQLLGVVRVAGSRALSEFVGVAQVSKGVQYLRGEYSQPLQGWASRWNVYGTSVRSTTDLKSEGNVPFEQRGQSLEWGAGLTTLQSTTRNGVWNSLVEASQRTSHSDISSRTEKARTRDRVDSQLRLGLHSLHTPGWVDRFKSETTLTLGQLDLGREDATFGQPDEADWEGAYFRIESLGTVQTALSDPKWTVTSRWRAQIVSQNMDGNNQIALGGANGIRAFDSDEGVGDEGVQVSLDLNRQINDAFYAGVFYDMGVVKTSKKSAGDTYSLQALGLNLGGKVNNHADWTVSTARSLGGTPSEGVHSKIGDWRTFFTANLRY